MPSSLQAEFKRNGLEDMLDKVYMRTAQLVKENENKPKGELEHLQQILPSIAFYETLRDKEGNQEKALNMFEKWCFQKIEKIAKIAKWIPVIMKIPGLYKKIPSFMNKLLDAKFGPRAGFEYIQRDCENGFAADMTKCPYVETCKKYGCPELAQFFCKSDDICYGNMHPKLIWGRSKTLGTGGDCCDFNLYM